MKITYQDHDGQVGELETEYGWQKTLMFLIQYRGDIERAWFDDYAMSGKPQYERQHELEWHTGIICTCDMMGDDMEFGLVALDNDGLPHRKVGKEWEQQDYCPYCGYWIARFDWRAKSRVPPQETE